MRDVAQTHLRLLVSPIAPSTSQRYLASSSSYTISEVSRILTKLYPEKKFPQPSDDEEEKVWKLDTPLSTERARKELGMEWRGLEECVRDTTERLLDLEAKGWDKEEYSTT